MRARSLYARGGCRRFGPSEPPAPTSRLRRRRLQIPLRDEICNETNTQKLEVSRCRRRLSFRRVSAARSRRFRLSPRRVAGAQGAQSSQQRFGCAACCAQRSSRCASCGDQREPRHPEALKTLAGQAPHYVLMGPSLSMPPLLRAVVRGDGSRTSLRGHDPRQWQHQLANLGTHALDPSNTSPK